MFYLVLLAFGDALGMHLLHWMFNLLMFDIWYVLGMHLIKVNFKEVPMLILFYKNYES